MVSVAMNTVPEALQIRNRTHNVIHLSLKDITELHSNLSHSGVSNGIKQSSVTLIMESSWMKSEAVVYELKM